MTWLITGGAGYIGAHVVRAMQKAGETVVVLDDLSTGSAQRLTGVELVEGSVLDGDLVQAAMRRFGVTGVVHVAAKKQVEESVRQPLYYYRENVEGLRVLLEQVAAAGVESFVFSSSAAVYGSPAVEWVSETTGCHPINPYGMTKLVGEHMVEAVAAATGLRYANLRYFNVAGTAAPELADRGVANLVPMVFRELSAGRPPLVFGTDYDTADGSCVRDFVHVADIASAHVAVARALAGGRFGALTANIGRGEGVSVLRMIEIIREVAGVAAENWSEPALRPRRPGDPARVVASADRLRDALGWRAAHSVEDMVSSAWAAWTAPAAAAPAGLR